MAIRKPVKLFSQAQNNQPAKEIKLSREKKEEEKNSQIIGM